MPYGDDYDPRTDPDAGSMARELAERVQNLLDADGHLPCSGHADSVYVPEGPDGRPVTMCGCGYFVTFTSTEVTVGGSTVARLAGGTAPFEARDPIKSTLALIDPSKVYTPEDVELHILDVLWRLETGALFERETIEAAYRAEQAYTVAFETAIHTSEQSSADRRKAEATVKTQQERATMMDAKMTKEAARQTMHNLRSVLTGYQSVARSIASAYQGGGSQGGPPQQGSYRR